MDPRMRQRRMPTFQDRIKYGFQASINTERAIVKVQEEEEASSRFFMVELLVIVACIVAYIYLEVQRAKEVHAELYAWLISTGWSVCSPLYIVLSIEWKWFNSLLGCASNRNFANSIFLAWYNRVIQPYLMNGGATALQLLFNTSIQMSGSGQNALQLICQAFNVRGSDPLARICYQPCPNPADGHANGTMNLIQGATGGAGSGAAVGMVLHSMELGTGAALGAIAVGAGVGLLGAMQQNSAQAANIRNTCATYAAGTSCWLPTGYCPS